MLKTEQRKFYKVQKGQTLEEIAAYFSTSAYLLVKENALTSPPFAGQILKIPTIRGNAYTVKAGDTKALLCGSEERYESRNGKAFYIGMRVIL